MREDGIGKEWEKGGSLTVAVKSHVGLMSHVDYFKSLSRSLMPSCLRLKSHAFTSTIPGGT